MYRFISKIVREDNVLSLTGNLIIAVLGFSGFALLARSLTPNQFAQWVLFIAGGSLVEMLRFGITNNGLVRFLAGASNKDSDVLIGSNVLISLLATVFISGLIILTNQIFHDSISSSSYILFFFVVSNTSICKPRLE
jgi:O-antigen/teichoic acid export membrane protein